MLRRGLRLSKRATLTGSVLAAVAMLVHIVPVNAQFAGPRRAPEAAQQTAPAPVPEASSTSHSIGRGERQLRFTATAGALAFGNTSGAVQADVAYVAYALDGVDPVARPVAFAFNGGPGSASTWLHLGTMGPWRVRLSAETISGKAGPALIENTDTWLDFADLVFIDPPGTGYSRLWPPGSLSQRSAGVYRDLVVPRPQGERREASSLRARNEGGPEWFWSLEGDVVTFAEFIAAWLERNGRKSSPVVLVGESYGGFRVPLIAELLAERHKVTVGAMVLVSPVLDFDGRRGWRSPQHYAALLPSIAATRLEREGALPTRALVAESESYASGQYVVDLLRGPRDTAAIDRMSERISSFSGLPLEAVQELAGRLTMRSFIERSPQLRTSVVSIYDAGMAGLVATPGGNRGGFADPFTAGLNPPLTAAMGTVHERLNWQPERSYAMLANDVNRRWRWPNSPHPPQVVSALYDLHRSVPRLRTLVVHGFTDLVTPYFASVMQLEQMPAHGPLNRIALEVYPGGHMFYSRDESRRRFRADAAKSIAEALGPRVPAEDTREIP